MSTLEFGSLGEPVQSTYAEPGPEPLEGEVSSAWKKVGRGLLRVASLGFVPSEALPTASEHHEYHRDFRHNDPFPQFDDFGRLR